MRLRDELCRYEPITPSKVRSWLIISPWQSSPGAGAKTSPPPAHVVGLGQHSGRGSLWQPPPLSSPLQHRCTTSASGFRASFCSTTTVFCNPAVQSPHVVAYFLLPTWVLDSSKTRDQLFWQKRRTRRASWSVIPIRACICLSALRHRGHRPQTSMCPSSEGRQKKQSKEKRLAEFGC